MGEMGTRAVESEAVAESEAFEAAFPSRLELRQRLALRSFCLQLADGLWEHGEASPGGGGQWVRALLALPLDDAVDALLRLLPSDHHPPLHHTCLAQPELAAPPSPWSPASLQRPASVASEPPPPSESRLRGPSPQRSPPEPAAALLVDVEAPPAVAPTEEPPQRQTRVADEARSETVEEQPVTLPGHWSPPGPPKRQALVVVSEAGGHERVEWVVDDGVGPWVSEHVNLRGLSQSPHALPSTPIITRHSAGGTTQVLPHLIIVTPGLSRVLQIQMTSKEGKPKPKTLVLRHMEGVESLSGSWQRCTRPVGQAVTKRAQVVGTEEGLVLVGGDAGDFRLHHVPLVRTTKSRRLPPLSSPRKGLAAAVLGGHVYVTGGEGRRRVERLSLGEPERGWESLAPLPSRVRDHAAAAFRGRLVVAGGRGASGELRRAVWALEPGAEAWERMGELERGRAGATLVEMGVGLVAVGGEGEEADTAHSAERWDEGERRWRLLGFRLKFPAHRAVVAALNIGLAAATPDSGSSV